MLEGYAYRSSNNTCAPLPYAATSSISLTINQTEIIIGTTSDRTGFGESYVPLPTNPVCDVLTMVKKLGLPTGNKKLVTISEHFGYKGGNYHEAIKDCDATNFV